MYFLGFPSSSQALFILETAMERLLPETVGRVQSIVAHLEEVESQMKVDIKLLKAQQLGELKLRNSNEEPTEQDLLEGEGFFLGGCLEGVFVQGVQGNEVDLEGFSAKEPNDQGGHGNKATR